MATFVPAANTAKLALQGTAFGNQIVNTLWVLFSQAVTQAMLDEIVTEAAAWWDLHMRPSYPAGMTLNTLTATDQSSQNGPTSTLTLDHAGTGSGPTNTTGSAIVVTERTANRGRSFRGRFYFGPLLQTAMDVTDKNQITPTYATAIGVAVAEFANAMAGMTVPGSHAVASHFHNNAPRAIATVTPIESYHADTFIDAQRRRLTGRGA